jgi:hypothetical protein
MVTGRRAGEGHDDLHSGESVSGRDSNRELLSTSLKYYHLDFVFGNDLA